MKILFVYPPFCTPTVMPYSISHLKGHFKKLHHVECLDLNAKFHLQRFPNYYTDLKKKNNKEYAELLTAFEVESRKTYGENNRTVVTGKKPELFNEMLSLILEKKPEIVAFSIVYSSQCFYALALVQELKKQNITCVIGGPAVNEKLHSLSDPVDFLYQPPAVDTVPDFSDYPPSDYLSRELIIPLKTASSCYYKQCAFCTHYAKTPYIEFPIETIKQVILNTKTKHVFFIDDMIKKERLKELAVILKPLSVNWWCQLKPTVELKGIFPELYDAGLHTVSWGVESGSQRILDLMNKGTTVSGVQEILKESHDAGIKNAVYAMFGFPTETKEEFFDTLNFLKENKDNIDLVTTSIFGLQKGSPAYAHPEKFSITSVQEQKRTVLDSKISYTVSKGQSPEEVKILRGKYAKSINNLDKVPRVFNCFKEQILLY
ncbi:MAG: B12-binding domain-containing radical SAM protein [Candidatus Woesearchaeota archaeon]|jgi:hypothetical protein